MCINVHGAGHHVFCDTTHGPSHNINRGSTRGKASGTACCLDQRAARASMTLSVVQLTDSKTACSAAHNAAWEVVCGLDFAVAPGTSHGWTCGTACSSDFGAARGPCRGAAGCSDCGTARRRV